jgi:hypothetical protein
MKQTGRIFECEIPASPSEVGVTTPVKIEVGTRGQVVVTVAPLSDRPAVMTFDSADAAKRSFVDLAAAVEQCNTL